MARFSKWHFRTRVRDAWERLRPPVRGMVRQASEDFSAAVPFEYNLAGVPAPSKPVGIICHLYHAELAPELRGVCDNIPFAADLLISTDTQAKSEQIKASFENWQSGAVEILIVPNRGRDIAPKFVTFRDAFVRYDLILFLHTKKSYHAADIGDLWRNTLMNSLAGSPDIVRSVLDTFDSHPEIGMVICQHFEPIREWVDWGRNFPEARKLAKRMGFDLTPSDLLDLPSGSMFWSRSAALRPLLEVGLTLEDFPVEKNQVCETLAHAIERILLYVCEKAGYGWIKVANPEFFSNGATNIPIKSRGDLDAFIETRRISLLSSTHGIRA